MRREHSVNELPTPSLSWFIRSLELGTLSTLSDQVLDTIVEGSAGPFMMLLGNQVAKRMLGEG